MRRLLLFSLFSISSVAVFGQLDLAITQIITPVNGTQVADLQQVTSTFVVKNTGTTTLAVNDSIFYRNELNGVIQSYTSGGQSFNVFLDVLTKTLAPNDTVHLSITLPTAWGNAGVPAGNSFTWGFNVRGKTCCPTVDDADLTNNVMTVNLNASSGTVSIDESPTASLNIFLQKDILTVSGTNHSGHGNLEIFNLLGQKIYEQPMSFGKVFEDEVNVSHLSGGIYIVTISNGNKVITSKKVMK